MSYILSNLVIIFCKNLKYLHYFRKLSISPNINTSISSYLKVHFNSIKFTSSNKCLLIICTQKHCIRYNVEYQKNKLAPILKEFIIWWINDCFLSGMFH